MAAMFPSLATLRKNTSLAFDALLRDTFPTTVAHFYFWLHPKSSYIIFRRKFKHNSQPVRFFPSMIFVLYIFSIILKPFTFNKSSPASIKVNLVSNATFSKAYIRKKTLSHISDTSYRSM